MDLLSGMIIHYVLREMDLVFFADVEMPFQRIGFVCFWLWEPMLKSRIISKQSWKIRSN